MDEVIGVPTFVYVMKVQDRLKIGVSVDCRKRKRQLENASGGDVVMVTKRQFSSRASALFVERTLHKRFARSRLHHGEWFRLAPDTVVAALHASEDPRCWDPGFEIIDL